MTRLFSSLFLPADTATREKLLLEFKNDSVYLSSYGFGLWYGQWFCDFYKASAAFEDKHLTLHAQVDKSAKWLCKNEEEDIWTKIEYQLIDSTDRSLTFVKVLDTSNCISQSIIQKLHDWKGRGGRDFPKGEDIRSDIQLR